MKEALESIFKRTFIDSGENLKARCPYHDESTPSFFVHKEEQVANCFGCGKGGYIDLLVASYLGIEPAQARKALGINRIAHNLAKSPYIVRKRPEYYPESWLHAWPRKVHKFILEREYETEVLRSTGTRYDSSQRRQVFPHRDRDGGLIGAFGRYCGHAQEDISKWYFYWNYPRGRTLYRPWSDPTNGHRVIVCEGALDILRIRQAAGETGEEGFDLAATLGTKVTKHHLRELREYDSVILAYDNDKSGKETTEKLYEYLRRYCEVQFAIFPGKDIGDLTDEQCRHVPFVTNVQRQILRTSEGGCSPLSKPEKGPLSTRPGDWKDNYLDWLCREALPA